MPKPYDTRLIMMVAQRWFETPDFNQFCKLIPIAYVDGTKTTKEEFPNDGEIWWMLTSQTGRFAEPGKLLVGSIEDAVRFDSHDPTASKYQVKRDSVQDLGINDGMDVVDAPADAFDDIHDVVSGGFQIELPAYVATSVMLRWRSSVYGPFFVSAVSGGDNALKRAYTLSPANAKDMTVYKIANADFLKAAGGNLLTLNDRVSLTSNRRAENYQLVAVSHSFLFPAGYQQALALGPEKIPLEPIERKLTRFAKQCLSRAKRQELQEILTQLETAGREMPQTDDFVEAVKRMRQVNEKQDLAINLVVKALLEVGLLGEDRIQKAEKAFAEKYVQQRTAELQAKVEESLSGTRSELKRAEQALASIQAKSGREELKQREKLERELAVEREKAFKEIAAERDEFAMQKLELKRQQDVLQKNLEKVTADLREAGDDVVNRFLTIAPLIKSLDFGKGRPTVEESPAENTSVATTEREVFAPPRFTRKSAADADPLAEDAFFERFSRLVEESGFTYRQVDLQRLHLSVKCGDITVLGGPSGTGKSSLAALYARALLGDESSDRPADCLMVNVNPSWMDIRDLLGHLNTLERRFYPAETGVFQYLVTAQEEHRECGAASGLYCVCLDEMNLSQVEHYFSDILQALERESDNRFVQCFSAESADKHCAFRGWGKVKISPAVRFLGTVNFDETTRVLSDRFLDRINLIRLDSTALPTSPKSANGTFARARGRMVTLGDFASWSVDTALPSEIGVLLDQLRPLLNQLGCPLSPRAYRAICRFVGSAASVMSKERAFDVQIAQRIVPKIRGLVRRQQLDAIDKLAQLIRSSPVCQFEETFPLIEEARNSASASSWDLEG